MKHRLRFKRTRETPESCSDQIRFFIKELPFFWVRGRKFGLEITCLLIPRAARCLFEPLFHRNFMHTLFVSESWELKERNVVFKILLLKKKNGKRKSTYSPQLQN